VAQLQANSIQIEYDTFGDRNGDPVLLIMGLGTQMTGWSPELCEALAAHGHYVIRFDNRDIGLSTKFDDLPVPGRLHFFLNLALRLPTRAPYTLTDMAHDAAGVLDALDIEASHVVGASMGGMIGQLLAFHYPQRVKSLTSLMSSSGKPNLPRARRDIAHHIFFSRPTGSDPEALVEHLVRSRKMIGSPAYPRSDAEWREQVVAAMQRGFYPPGFGRQTAAVIADGSRVQRLRQLQVPTLVIHGRDDPLIPVAHGIDTAEQIPGARLEIIDGMGHDIPPPLVPHLTSLIIDHARDAGR
jgi:pimeloyl-ACP methyl ester carboxylesterase